MTTTNIVCDKISLELDTIRFSSGQKIAVQLLLPLALVTVLYIAIFYGVIDSVINGIQGVVVPGATPIAVPSWFICVGALLGLIPAFYVFKSAQHYCT
jgi:hypothetical protein